METGMIGFSEKDFKVMEFESFIKGHSENLSLRIFRVDEENERVFIGNIKNADLSNLDIFEFVQKKYGGGNYFIQCVVGNKLGQGSNLSIAKTEVIKESDHSSNLEKKIDSFQSAVLEILKNQTQKKETSREEMLKEMMMMKEMFSSNIDMTKIYTDMAKVQREAFALGKEFQLPEVEEKEESSMDKFMPIIGAGISALLAKFQGNQAIQPNLAKTETAPVYQTAPTEEKKVPTENDEMILQILSTVTKIKKTSALPEGEEKEYKIELLADDIQEFFPQINDFIDTPIDLGQIINEYAGKYGQKITETEINTARRICEKIKTNRREENNVH